MRLSRSHIAENIYTFYDRVAELCAYEQGALAGCRYVWNKKGSWPSFMLGNPVPDSVSEADSAMSEKLAPSFWIMEKPEPDVVHELDKAGIRTIREWKGMELHQENFLPGERTLKKKSDSEIIIRTNDPDLKSEWLKIVNEELLSGSQMGPEFLESISRSGQFRWMLAFLDGHPVGTGLSFSENGVCGLYMIATKTSSRGKGVGTRLSAELVRQAIAAGDTHFVLHATELGAPIYENLGFREVNTFSVLWNLGC